MSTNYYARIIPSEEEKESLINAINENRFDDADRIYEQISSYRDSSNINGRIIHLGKRSAGWKFLWNPNVIKYGILDANNNFNYDYDYVYPLTKDGILNFIKRPDVIIKDEYGRIIDSNEFFDMALNWCPNGYDSKTYEESHKSSSYYRSNEMWSNLGFEPQYYDFYSDGLLFATDVEFS